jgi:hypothetical protein
MGFNQHDNTRVYRFDGLENGQLVAQFVVTADLTLFLKHHVNIQEGPDLCARKLSADQTNLEQHDHQLTNEDFLAFATARADAEARKAEVRRKANLRRRPRFRPNL